MGVVGRAGADLLRLQIAAVVVGEKEEESRTVVNRDGCCLFGMGVAALVLGYCRSSTCHRQVPEPSSASDTTVGVF
jgi:hypothetical protein